MARRRSRTVTSKVPPEVRRKVEAAAAFRGESISAFARQALERAADGVLVEETVGGAVERGLAEIEADEDDDEGEDDGTTDQ